MVAEEKRKRPKIPYAQRSEDKPRVAPPGRRLYSLQEAANYLGCSTRAVRSMIADGTLRDVSWDSRIRIPLVDLKRLAKDHE